MIFHEAWRLLSARLHTAPEALRARVRNAPMDRWRPRVAFAALGLLVASAVAVAGIFAWAASCGFAGCPSDAELRAWTPPDGGQVLDREGELIGRLATYRQVTVGHDQVPDVVRQAFIAVEDRRFHEHDGVDWRGVLRAAWRNVSALDIREGSSTITMQAARSAFLRSREGERSVRRKLLELAYAHRLEQALSKPEILDLYLNVIYLGDDTYGVEAASRHWFDTSADELTLQQAALLAALPRAPALYDPRKYPDRARARRDAVLALMAEQGFISEDEAARAREAPLGVSRHGWQPDVPDGWAAEVARAFADSVLDGELQRLGDVVIHTTFEKRAQQAAERAAGRAEGGRAGLEVALVALDPKTGALRALAGGRRYTPLGFNRAFDARRQPGSAFKPFVYVTAMDAGLTAGSMVDDEPVQVAGAESIWRPANADGAYQGRVTLRQALATSANAAAVRVSQAVGMPRVVRTARSMGITSPLDPVPAAALGAFEVTPLELATAYAPLANGGDRVAPHFVTRIEAPDGKVLWESEVEAPSRAIDPEDAFLVTSMLESAVNEGTGVAVRVRGVGGRVAGKTGTSNDGADAWFVGYTPDLVAAVWVGADQRRAVPGASGGRLAAPIWADFFRAGWTPSRKGWQPPPGLVQVEIDPETGQLAGQYCPVRQWEWYKSGTEPTETCEEHHDLVAAWLEGAAEDVGGFLKGLLDR